MLKAKMKILFTGVGRRVELLQEFKKAALALGKELKIYGADTTRTAPALAYCDYVRLVVSMEDAGYISQLVEICRDDQIDLVIPTIDTDLLLLSQNREGFETVDTKVMISSPDMIQICRNKNNTSQFFMDCGLYAPMPVNNWQAYKGGYPAFIKPKDGSSSINAFKISDEKELEIYANKIVDYVVQPFVSGIEYTIDIFCDWKGEPISIVPRERMSVRAGEVLKTRIFMDKTMIDEARRICKGFKPCGPITVQLIRDVKGIDWYIEINPRFGGGAPLSMKAGARSAEMILKLLDMEKVKDNHICIADGAIYSRFDQSVCVQEARSQIKGVIFDLDDTLYSERDYVKSGYKIVAEYLGDKDYECKLWSYFQEGKSAIDELLRELGRENEKDIVVKLYRSHKPNIQLYPGVIRMIEELKRRDIRVGIITDGRPEGQRNKLEALGLDIKDVIITDELGGIQFRKPCDIAFRIMAYKWKLPYEQIVYIGDNPTKDYQAPQQLGIRFIYFENIEGLYQGDKNFQTVFDSFEKIQESLLC